MRDVFSLAVKPLFEIYKSLNRNLASKVLNFLFKNKAAFALYNMSKSSNDIRQIIMEE